MLELAFKATGTVNVNCDVTNEPFELPIEGNLNLIVKFGHEYNDGLLKCKHVQSRRIYNLSLLVQEKRENCLEFRDI